MEKDFRTILTEHVPLTALVPATRIFTAYYPQAATDPAIRLTKISGVTGLHMRGSDGLSESTMQIDIRGLASAGAAPVMAIRDVLVALLHPWRGIKGATDFRLINLSTDRGMNFEKPTTVEYLTASLDFDVWSKAVQP